jgi:hypothetical protein
MMLVGGDQGPVLLLLVELARRRTSVPRPVFAIETTPWSRSEPLPPDCFTLHLDHPLGLDVDEA